MADCEERSTPASSFYPVSPNKSKLVLAFGFTVALFLAGCTSVPRHQKGGGASQSLSPLSILRIPDARLDVPPPEPGPSQSLSQPENPEGESAQEITRTITTTSPDGSVVTTVERATTKLGGSQSLTDMIKEAVGADQLRALLLALIMAFTAFLCRHSWPFVAVALAVGAVVVAVFGIAYALAFGGIGLGAVVAYYIARAQLAPLS
jgi:hypothetical protein